MMICMIHTRQRSKYPSTCACANACHNFLLRLRLLALLGLCAGTSLLPFNPAWTSVNTFCCLLLPLRAFLALWTPCTSRQTRRNMLLYSLLKPLCGPPDIIVPTCTTVQVNDITQLNNNNPTCRDRCAQSLVRQSCSRNNVVDPEGKTSLVLDTVFGHDREE